jgi:extracellular elastinolytic metalloproteinase
MKRTCIVWMVAAAASASPAWAAQRPGDTPFLTGPQRGEPLEIATGYLRSQAGALGLDQGDLAELAVSSEYQAKDTGVTYLYLQQRHQGIDVWNAIVNFSVMKDGRILSLGDRAVRGLERQAAGQAPSLSALDAVQAALGHLGLKPAEALAVDVASAGADQAVTFSGGGIAPREIPVKLVWQPLEKGGLRLAWNVNLELKDGSHWWSVRVDAENGKVLDKNDWVVDDEWPIPSQAETRAGTSRRGASPAPGYVTPNPVNDGTSYKVFELPVESPNHTSPAPPADGRTTVSNPADATASPFGWQDTNGVAGPESTTTVGNNVQACTDTDANNVCDTGSSPDAGAGLAFSFPLDLTLAPSGYRPAAVTNLFYWNNLMHDINYVHGFDDVSGNFQVNNYGRGGLGNDSVQAEAQDGSGTNNANFGTPPDGQRPRMQMYVWTAPTPDKDGDLDNGIITHEYGHGVSNRLTGGPANVSCLNNNEQMGEGWSDWMSVILTMRPGDTATTQRGVGTYALNQPTTGPGIRAFPYSTSLATDPRTYDSIKTAAVPHGVGSVWTAMLWEMNWELIAKHGFNPDLYGAWNTGGNNLAHRLVLDGMKLQPCSPGFVDGRNAILAADVALTGGANQCEIWKAFAKRGLGFSASQGSSTSVTDGTQAFDLPPSCTFGNVTPPSQSVCTATTSSTTYTVNLGPAWPTAPVSLSASGNPAGSTVGFVPASVSTLPGSSTLTVGGLGSLSGSSSITVTGTDSSAPTPVVMGLPPVSLNLFASTPATPTLTAPANGATAQNTSLTLSWSAAAEATSYVVEVDDNADFSSISFTTTVSGTTATATGLQALTTYYWRVRPTNVCGSGGNSAAFSFTTSACASPNLAIPDNNTTGVSSDIVIPAGANLADLNLGITAAHTWVGDLIFTLTHVDTGTSVVVINRPTNGGGSCSNDNVGVTLDDEGADGAVQAQCRAAAPALFGKPTPANPLSAFDAQSYAGTWRLKAADVAAIDTGTLQSWCLLPSFPAVAPTVASPTATSITSSGATLGGDVSSDGGSAITERGVVYSATSANSDPAIGGMGVLQATASGTTGVFAAPVGGLLPATSYSFKAYATNALGTSYTSPASTFQTLADPPTVTSPTSASVTASSAVLGGNVSSDGGSAITERGVVYAQTGTNSDPDIGEMGVTKLTASGTTGAFSVPASGLAASTGYSFKAYATNAAGTSYTSPASTFTTTAKPAGTITITKPIAAGLVWRAGTVQGIQWSHNLGSGSLVNVEVSRDNGGNWAPLATNVVNGATIGTYNWTVTAPTTTQARFRVTSVAFPAVQSTNPQPVTITSRVQVTAPNTASSLSVGQVLGIKWTHNYYGPQHLFRVDLDRDGNGSCEEPIATGVLTTTANGLYNWTVTAPPSPAARICVTSETDALGTDISDAPFSIARVNVTAPNSTSRTIGTAVTITWTHSYGAGHLFDIGIDRNGDRVCEETITTGKLGTATGGSHTWTVTGPASAINWICVKEQADPVGDLNTTAFPIVP